MIPTRWFAARAGVAFFTLGVCVASCSDRAEKSADTQQAGAAGASEHRGGAGGELSPPLTSGGAAGAHDSSYAGNATAGETCLPGLTRCHGELGFQRCEPDGVWGESQSCGGYSENGTSSYCAVVSSGEEPWAACVDPACWWWSDSGFGDATENAGACVGTDQIRICHADGILARPVPCQGVCRVVGELDGRALGYCDPACEDGERECLAGPLYRQCERGAWSTRVDSCEGGETCQPLTTGLQLDIKCGGTCEAGTSRCSDDATVVETCSPEGRWQAAPACLRGRCLRSGAQAQCQTECAAGEHACAFDGDVTELVCEEQGLWAAPSVCEAGSFCRVGAAGALGCVPCVGPELPGGNAWGVSDSRCQEDGVATCGAANSYEPPEACAGGCVELQRGAALLAYCE